MKPRAQLLIGINVVCVLLLAVLTHAAATGSTAGFDLMIVLAAGYLLAIVAGGCAIAAYNSLGQPNDGALGGLWQGLEKLAKGDRNAAVPLPIGAGAEAEKAIQALRARATDSPMPADAVIPVSAEATNATELALLKQAMHRARQLGAEAEQLVAVAAEGASAMTQLDAISTQSTASSERLAESLNNATESVTRGRQGLRQLQDLRVNLENVLPGLRELAERNNVLGLNVALQGKQNNAANHDLIAVLATELKTLADDARDIGAEFTNVIDNIDSACNAQDDGLADASSDLKSAAQGRSEFDAAQRNLATSTQALHKKLEGLNRAGGQQQRSAAELIRDLARLAGALSGNAASEKNA